MGLNVRNLGGMTGIEWTEYLGYKSLLDFYHGVNSGAVATDPSPREVTNDSPLVMTSSYWFEYHGYAEIARIRFKTKDKK